MSMRRAIVPTILLTVTLAAPVAASAAAPWSEPLTVPDSQAASPFTVGLSVGTSDRGALGFSNNAHPELLGSPQTGAIAGVGHGAPGVPHTLSPYDLAAAPVAYGAIHAVVLQQRFTHRGPGIHRLAVSLASLPGQSGTRRVLDSSVKLLHAAAAANPAGQAAVAWTEDRGYSGRRANNDRLYLSTRRPGGSFGKSAVLVGSGKLSSVSVAYGPNGHLLVAFERQAIGRDGRPGPRRVQARFRRVGRGFGPITDLGPEQGVTDLTTAVATNGRAYVAWGTQDGGIEANDPFNVYAATKPAGPGRFRRAVHLFSGRGRSVDRPRGRLSIAIDRSGADAMLAFTGVGDGGAAVGSIQPVLASRSGGDGTFQAPRAVPLANGAVGGIAVEPGGRATVVWTGLKPGSADESTGVFAATAPPGGVFGALPEVVSATPPAPTSIPSVALPAGGGEVQAAWYEQKATGIRFSRRAR
jgi:hypothetical protein